MGDNLEIYNVTFLKLFWLVMTGIDKDLQIGIINKVATFSG